MILYILFSVSLLINLLLIYGVWNLLRKIRSIEDLMIDTIADAKENIQTALSVMEAADINGSFESDDEVGAAFKDIKKAISDLNKLF